MKSAIPLALFSASLVVLSLAMAPPPRGDPAKSPTKKPTTPNQPRDGGTTEEPGTPSGSVPEKPEGHNPEGEPSKPIGDLRLTRILPNVSLRRPVQVVQAPGDDDHLYIVEQSGRIYCADLRENDAKTVPLFLDIRQRVNDKNNEEGLLSLCFHPDFQKNGQFFVDYTAEPPKRSVISRFKVGKDGRGDPDSEEVLLEVGQPYWNHNGGTIVFGPDRMLYIGFGDGGAANDPHFNGQNLGVLLAKILRIDVDHADPGLKYSIPKDNPFVKTKGARGEVWCYGMRNPWRMSFDRKTGDLWVGDVGQNIWEEIDLCTKGGNYGWNPREGFHAFGGGKPGNFGSDYIDPIVDYKHINGDNSVTGGCVYRGTKNPAMEGVYVYGDFGSGRIWGLRYEDGKACKPRVLINGGRSRWSSFDQLNDGTIIGTSMEGGERGPGALYRLSMPEPSAG